MVSLARRKSTAELPLCTIVELASRRKFARHTGKLRSRRHFSSTVIRRRSISNSVKLSISISKTSSSPFSNRAGQHTLNWKVTSSFIPLVPRLFSAATNKKLLTITRSSSNEASSSKKSTCQLNSSRRVCNFASEITSPSKSTLKHTRISETGGRSSSSTNVDRIVRTKHALSYA